MSDTNGNGSLSVENVPKAHEFQPGNKVAIGFGRPKGSLSWERQMRLALATVERKKKIPFLVHAIERAYASDKVLPHVLDRVVPKLASDDDRSAAPIVINIVNFSVPGV